MRRSYGKIKVIFSKNRRWSWALPVILLMSIGGLAPTAQELSAPRFTARTNLILVDVHVRDKNNRPIPGLTARDFVLLEEGVVQNVTYFQEIILPANQGYAGSVNRAASPGFVR